MKIGQTARYKNGNRADTINTRRKYAPNGQNTTETEKSEMEKMTPKKMLENATDIQASGKNYLFSGPPGTGKSAMVRAYCKKLGLTLCEFNMATFDVYTDLIGIPVPQIDADGNEYLGRLRPASINSAHVIFFDEINRAEPAALNALLGICNERTINGEPLPNLQTVFAAMNPAGTETGYLIAELGNALNDRLLCKYDVPPVIDTEYLATVHGESVANALAEWHSDIEQKQRDVYLSPRTLDAIGSCYVKSNRNKFITKSAIPEGIRDTGKLFALLDAAIDGKTVAKSAADDTLTKTAPTYTAAATSGTGTDRAHEICKKIVIQKMNEYVLSDIYRQMEDSGCTLQDMKNGVEAFLRGVSQPSYSKFRRVLETYRPKIGVHVYLQVFAEGYNQFARNSGHRVRTIK